MLNLFCLFFLGMKTNFGLALPCPEVITRQPKPVFTLLGLGGHSTVAGSITVLHPYWFPLAVLMTSSRILMNYQTPFQVLAGYVLGATVMNIISSVIEKPTFFPISTLAFSLKILIHFGFISPYFGIAPFLLVWFPILVQVIEPY